MNVSTSDQAANGKPLQGLSVLIVEDEPLLLMDAEDQVRELGCETILTALNAETAARLASAGDYDLAMLDVNLGDSTAEDVARVVASRDRPVIFVTGYVDEFEPPVPSATILAKPFAPVALRNAFRKVLDGRNKH